MNQPRLLQRAWMATPDGAFRALGAVFFAGLIALEVQDLVAQVQSTPGGFGEAFWRFGSYWESDGSSRDGIYLPWGRLLYLTTYVLIGLSFVIRMPPLSRAMSAREIVIPLIGAFWPFLPFVIKHAWHFLDGSGAAEYAGFMFENRWTRNRFLTGAGLVMAGNALDVWGYAVLCRSLSIVAEPRALKVSGPYRFVRHPVYLGQILAQAGVWLFIAHRHWVWFAFYACFVAMQLYRGRVEDAVLERAFGERYREWKRRTFWFF